MSLLNNTAWYGDCQIINRVKVPDGYGGVKIVWQDGAVFKATIPPPDNDMQTQVALTQGVTSIYTVTTTKDIVLDFHDVFRRLSDGKVFRVTTDGDDNATPDAARLNMRQVRAEEWELPNE